MRVSTEKLVTSPMGFGLTTATNVQRAVCRVRDGLPLRELATDPQVIAAVGGEDALRHLPSERGIKPLRFYCIASPRTAKTTIAVAGGVADALNADLSSVGTGQMARTSYLSLKLDLTDIARNLAKGLFEHSDDLRPLYQAKTQEAFHVRRPSDGKIVEFACTAGGAAAGGIAGRWSTGVLLDEGPKMASRSDGAVTNIDDAVTVGLERLLPGAAITVIGSPWSPSGHCYSVVEEFFGRPTDEVVCMRMTGPAANPHHWTPKRLESLDEIGLRIVRDGLFVDPEAGLLSPIALHQRTRKEPLELPPDRDSRYVAAIDPSEGLAHANSWALTILETVPPGDQHGFRRLEHAREWVTAEQHPTYRVALVREFRGASPLAVLREISQTVRRYGLRLCYSDQWSAAANADLARQVGLNLKTHHWNQSNKLEAYDRLATLVHEGRIELSPDKVLQDDLRSLKRRATQDGAKIVMPAVGGRHCDAAASLALALVYADKGAGNPLKLITIRGI